MLLCLVKGSSDIFGAHFLGSEPKWSSGYLLGCGQDREGPLVVEGKLLLGCGQDREGPLVVEGKLL